MKQYPDTEAYMINYYGGSFGSFITGLILLFLNVIPENEQIEFSINGNSHRFASLRSVNYNRADTNMMTDQIYDKVEPVNPLTPLVMAGHAFPIWDDLFYYYPKCKNIIVTFTKADKPRLMGNIFFKAMVDEFHEGNADAKLLWESFKSRRPAFFEKNNIIVPEDLTSAQLEVLLARALNINEKYIIEDYSDNPNVFYLPMSDIVHNKNKTLLTLEQITNRRITPRIIETYDKFLLAQDKLVKTKMPWVRV